MEILEKYRDYKLISKLLALLMFFDAGASILSMFIRMIVKDWSFSIWTIIGELVTVAAGFIFLMGKFQDKTIKLCFSGVLILTRLAVFIEYIAYDMDGKYIFSQFLELLLVIAFSLYYLGFIRAGGRKNYFIFMYVILGIAAIFNIFSIGSMSILTFAVCAALMLYSFPETRAQNPNFVYAGMIRLAYISLYLIITNLLNIINSFIDKYLSLPSFFGHLNIVCCFAVPLLVYDRIVPGEGQPFAFDMNALSGNGAQPVQYQQNGFDPMTGQPLNPQPQQNGFDPMTGQPLNAQPQQNGFDPMTGQPLGPNGGQQ